MISETTSTETKQSKTAEILSIPQRFHQLNLSEIDGSDLDPNHKPA